MPPLRDRRDDIPLLLDHYVKQFSEENAVTPVTFEGDVTQILRAYNWPGNIRELRNFAENMVVMRRGREFRASTWTSALSAPSPACPRPRVEPPPAPPCRQVRSLWRRTRRG
jgi:DNA-binding NtrC family response regulator